MAGCAHLSLHVLLCMLMLVTAVPLQGSQGFCSLNIHMVHGSPCQFFSRMGLLIKVAIDITDMAEADPKPKHKRKHHGVSVSSFC